MLSLSLSRPCFARCQDVRIVQGGRVGNVEHLGAQLNVDAFSDLKLAEKPEVRGKLGRAVRLLNPTVPKRASVTGAKANGSNQLLPTPSGVATLDLTWSARCELPGVFKEVREAPR